MSKYRPTHASHVNPRRAARRRRAMLPAGLVIAIVSFVSLLVTSRALAAPVSSATPTSLNLSAQAWWGGPSYYSTFPKASASGWTDPSFFPISVFLGKPEHAASLKSIGVNTYMGAEHDGSTMASITATGMSVIAQDEWSAAEVGTDPRAVGWFLSDECDMGLSDCGADEATQLATQTRYAAAARGRNDGRFLQANFGNGVLGTFWSPDTMAQQVSLVDVSSVDKYAYTSPDARYEINRSPYWTQGDSQRAITYGWLQDRMQSFSSPAGSKPNWVFVETAMPYLTESGATSITGDQIGGAVWNGLIHGAAGIAYFQHNNNGTCGNYSLVECPDSRAAVAKVNAEVASLAPVLNSQPYQWNFGANLQASLHVYNGDAYVIAMTTGGTGSRTFTLPSGVMGTSVEVVGENRTLSISNGTYTDSFAAEYSHHVYRVNLGSGAPAPTGAPGSYGSLTPSRILDTRSTGRKLGADESFSQQVTGVGGVPASGVSAVVLNVTVTETTTAGYLTLSPTGTGRPTASNLNWSGRGTTIPNAVTVKVGSGGKIDLYQSGPGSVQVVVDVAGYYVGGTVTEPGGFEAITPSRILDTRTTTGGGEISAGETRDLQILGVGGVPAGNVSAVVLNVTVTDTTGSGYLTLFPSRTVQPLSSNLNWSPGTTIPNLVVVKVGAAGKASIYQSGPGTAQVVMDVAGYYLGGSATQPGMFVALDPARVLDTRNSSPVPSASELAVPVLGRAGLPATGVAAVVINTTVTETTLPGYLTVFPGATPLPTASNLNWSAAGTTIANLVTVRVGSDSKIKLHNGSGGTTQVVADIAGYYIRT